MELLKRLTSAFGPSGCEENVAGVIELEIREYVDSITRDKLGNIIALKKGTSGKKLMLAAHMDQIGVMVTDIDEDGFLSFINVGGINPYTILHHNVIFENGATGIIAREEKSDIKDLKIENLYIDMGTSSKGETQKLVSIGDFGVFKSEFIVSEDRIFSGALDNRIGCYIMIEALKSIKNNKSDIYFVFTTQEETYTSGATVSAYAIDPDCAIVVDVTGTGDTPGSNRMAVKMGEGAAIKVMDKGMICHPKVKKYLRDIANQNNIKYQLEVLEKGSTDGSQIHISRSGVPTGGISIPARYIHTPQESVNIKDVIGAVDILKYAVEQYE